MSNIFALTTNYSFMYKSYWSRKKLNSKKSFVWIKRNITPKEHQLVNDLGIPGLYFETSEKRAYPNGELFAHALGYVGLDGNGLAGIEKQYDNYLKYYRFELSQFSI